MAAARSRMSTTPETSARMSRQAARDTSIEMALRRQLHRLGLRYRVHRRPLPELRREADIVFGPARVAVLVDGCFWHGCPDHVRWPANNAGYWRQKIEGNQARDRATDEALVRAGWLPLRVWEHEAPEAAARRIEEAVAARRTAPGGGAEARQVRGNDGEADG